MESLKRMFRKKRPEETLKEPKPDIRREFINGKWREVRHYSENERLVPLSYANREAMKWIKEMLNTEKVIIPLQIPHGKEEKTEGLEETRLTFYANVPETRALELESYLILSIQT
jgi:hypothetical protein